MAHPLARALAAYGFANVELVGRQRLSMSSAGTLVSGKYGLAYRQTATNTAGSTFAQPFRNIPDGTQYSVICLAKPETFATGSALICVPFTSTWISPFTPLLLRRSGTTSSLSYFTCSAALTREAISDTGAIATTDEPTVYGFTRNGTAVRFFVNGTVHGAQKTLSTNEVSAFSNNRRPIVLMNSGANTEGMIGTLSVWAIWSRALTDAEMAQISNDPWQVLHSVPSRRHFFASGGLSSSVGQALEADSAQAIVWAPLTRLVDQSLETDLAQPIAWSPITRLVDRALETDLAQAVITGGLSVLVNQAMETDVSQAVTWLPVRLISQVTETDQAQAVTWPPTRLITQVTEVDLAQIVTLPGGQTIAVGQVAEIDLAQGVAWVPVRLISQAIETDQAQGVTSEQIRLVGQAVEVDIAQGATWVPVRLVGQVTELDVAQAIFGFAGVQSKIYSLEFSLKGRSITWN